MRRSGWTLIELMAVLALLSVLMAGAVVVVRAPLTQGRLQMSIETALVVDQTARTQAVRTGRPCELHFVVSTPTQVTVERPPPGDSVTHDVAALAEVRRAQQVRAADDVRIPIGSDGRSPTYGLRFVKADGTATWIVIAGGTGQPMRNLKRQDADALLEAY